MTNDFIWTVLDEDLLKALRDSLSRERKQKAAFVVCLAEVDRRLLYAEKGYPSLLEFCERELNLSQSSALKRIQLARLYRRFVGIEKVIESGEISLTALLKLSPHLTSDNLNAVLDACSGKSVREVEKYIGAELRKESPKGVEIRLLVSEELAEKLERAKDLLSHKYPKGGAERIIEESLDVLIAKLDIGEKPNETRRRFTKTGRSQSRYIPRFIRQEVWKRDGGCCTWVSAEGRKCGGKRFLEWDHKTPFAVGGSSTTVENIRLLCHTHNKLEARRVFGNTAQRWMMVGNGAANT